MKEYQPTLFDKTKGALTQLAHTSFMFFAFVASLAVHLEITPIVLLIAFWCGTQDNIWSTVPTEVRKNQKSQTQYRYYLHAKLWLFFIGIVSFCVEYLIR